MSSVRSPVQERAQVTRDRLLEAALRSFAGIGYEASTTRQIESDAGVKRGLIGYHFGTKEQLWKATAAWMFKRTVVELEHVESGAADIDLLARLRYFVRAFVRFHAEFPEVNRLMIREGMENDWRLDWLIEHGARPWYRRLERLFNEAKAAELAPNMPFLHFYYILIGAASLLFSQAPEAAKLSGADIYDETVVSTHADVLAELLFPGDSANSRNL